MISIHLVVTSSDEHHSIIYKTGPANIVLLEQPTSNDWKAAIADAVRLSTYLLPACQIHNLFFVRGYVYRTSSQRTEEMIKQQ
jgi:hypothetical protein